jgi:transcriptional regulatory protein LevR
LSRNYEIICTFGTYDPELYEIPFILITKLFDTDIEKLAMLLNFPEIKEMENINYHGIFEYLEEQMPELDIKKVKKGVLSFVKNVIQEI